MQSVVLPYHEQHTGHQRVRNETSKETSTFFDWPTRIFSGQNRLQPCLHERSALIVRQALRETAHTDSQHVEVGILHDVLNRKRSQLRRPEKAKKLVLCARCFSQTCFFDVRPTQKASKRQKLRPRTEERARATQVEDGKQWYFSRK